MATYPSRFCLILLLLVLAVVAPGCGKKVIRTPSYQPQTQTRGQAVLQTARSQIGRPYHWGGTSPQTGFDCSGLAWWAYRVNGVDIPRVSKDQFRTGLPVAYSSVQPGDLAFFSSPGKGADMHVGIHTARGTMIHSPKTGHTVREESLMSSYWRTHYLGSRRFLR